jgi:hypothetical protein
MWHVSQTHIGPHLLFQCTGLALGHSLDYILQRSVSRAFSEAAILIPRRSKGSVRIYRRDELIQRLHQFRRPLPISPLLRHSE